MCSARTWERGRRNERCHHLDQVEEVLPFLTGSKMDKRLGKSSDEGTPPQEAVSSMFYFQRSPIWARSLDTSSFLTLVFG